MRRSWSLFAVSAWLTLQGCYEFIPTSTTTPPTGETVVLQISDRGRVALGERLGPGVTQIQGRVTSVADDQVSMSVASVGYVSGETSLWSGETMTMSREFVGNVSVRTFSKSRTWVAVGASVAVAGFFIATRGLSIFFNDLPKEPGDGTEGPVSFRLKFGISF
jgi:hypothetical protein